MREGLGVVVVCFSVVGALMSGAACVLRACWVCTRAWSMQEANLNPNTACGGTPAEMVCPGGELAFIMRMVEDSVRLGPRVHW